MAWGQEYGAPWRYTHDLLATMACGMPSGIILNVGAGPVKAWRKLCQRFKKWMIVQTDAVWFDGLGAQANIEALPFASGSFAGVFCVAVLEHVRRPWLTFGEMGRVLVEGGLLLVIAPWMWQRHMENDFWRFHEHAYEILADGTGLNVMKTGMYMPMARKSRKSGCWVDSWAILCKGRT